MGSKTKIDWADATWNPVTGCLRGCEYCYARRIAERFSAEEKCLTFVGDTKFLSPYELEQPAEYKGKKEPYPFGFSPTLHRYRLDEPKKWEKPRTIFVCSMADLFGEWVPDAWIREVFEACEAAPQHRYLFLTKNAKRYRKLQELLPLNRRSPHGAELWFGASYTGEPNDLRPRIYGWMNQFTSVEPLLKEPSNADCYALALCNDWVIVGAETGTRKNKIVPKKSWIEKSATECAKYGTPIFMKESLRDLMGDGFRQEYPWRCEHE